MSVLNWSQIDTVLLDMDGTLLDLHFDNYFWLEHLPNRYAQLQGISRAQADVKLKPLFVEHAGKLTWYCLDFWGEQLGVCLVELKREVAHLIAQRPGAVAFLQRLNQAQKRCALITNAHRNSLDLKMQHIDLSPYFARLISSHDYQTPKEEQAFWQALQADFGFDPARTLFIDDSLAMLKSASLFGIAHVRGVRYPDSQQGPRDCAPFAAIEDFAELGP